MTEWGRYGSECGPVQFGKRGKIMRVCRVSMANRFALRTLCLPALILLVSGAGEGWGQSGGEIDRLDLMPGGIARQVNALGPRVRTSGQVHMVLQGEFSAAGERRAAQVRRELSGNIRLDGFKPGGASLSFDGERSYRASSPTDYALLETFGQDMAEGMFVSLMRGGAAQLLGLRFGPDRKTNPTYTGPLLRCLRGHGRSPDAPGLRDATEAILLRLRHRAAAQHAIHRRHGGQYPRTDRFLELAGVERFSLSGPHRQIRRRQAQVLIRRDVGVERSTARPIGVSLKSGEVRQVFSFYRVLLLLALIPIQSARCLRRGHRPIPMRWIRDPKGAFPRVPIS